MVLLPVEIARFKDSVSIIGYNFPPDRNRCMVERNNIDLLEPNE